MRIILLSTLLLPAAAHAERRIEVGLSIGGHAFSADTELGVDDRMDEPGPASAGLLGVRVAVPIVPRLAIEGEATWVPTEDDVLGDDVDVYGLRAHARVDLLTGQLRPFVVAGFGGHFARTDSAQMDDDADKAYHWGGGVRYAINDTLDARADVRHLIVPDRTLDGATSDYEVTAGITYRFGGAPRPLPPPAPVIVVQPAPAPPPPPPPPPPPAPVIEELAGIGFELASAKIDIASAPILERAYQMMVRNPKVEIEISGHTSSEGEPMHNLALSLQRAQAVKDYLVMRGIDERRIHAIGHGSDIPLGSNATDEGRRRNRRIEFRILPRE